MDLTSRLQLKKPLIGEDALISDINENMDKLDAQAAGPLLCTSTTRPAAPYIGQHIWETNTGYEKLWNGTAWVWVAGKVPGYNGIKTDSQVVVGAAVNIVNHQLDTVIHNGGGLTLPTSAGPALTNSGFTVTEAGIWLIETNVFDAGAGGVQTWAGFNGNVAAVQVPRGTGMVSGGSSGQVVTRKLAVGNTVHHLVFVNTGQTLVTANEAASIRFTYLGAG